MPRRGHRPCRRRDLQIRRHHALCHAHEPYFSGRSQKPDHHLRAGRAAARCAGGCGGGGSVLSARPGRKDRLDRRQRHHERRRHEGRALRPDARFRALHRSGPAGRLHHEFLVQRCQKHHRLRYQGSGHRLGGHAVHPDAGYAQAAACADLLVHARHAVWQSGGVRGHGARGAGAAVYPDGDRVP